MRRVFRYLIIATVLSIPAIVRQDVGAGSQPPVEQPTYISGPRG
jgi:hypothetical protein